MTVLTIYTDSFDSKENAVNGGMSGKAFIDIDNSFGMAFKNLDSALEYCTLHAITPNRIDFNYLGENGCQMFRKYNVS